MASKDTILSIGTVVTRWCTRIGNSPWDGSHLIPKGGVVQASTIEWSVFQRDVGTEGKQV